MTTIDGVEYHVVPSPMNSCSLSDKTRCHFNFDDCNSVREQHPCTHPPVVFLTRDEYITHIARKFTS